MAKNVAGEVTWEEEINKSEVNTTDHDIVVTCQFMMRKK